jgi:hypothetical protein
MRDTTTGSERNLVLKLKEISGATFSPDANLFAAPSWGGLTKLWDATTFQELATLRGFLLGTHSVAFSPNSKRLAIGGDEREAIKLWDVESRQELLTLEGEGSQFIRTAFSTDGNILGSMNWAGVLHSGVPSWGRSWRRRRKRQDGKPITPANLTLILDLFCQPETTTKSMWPVWRRLSDEIAPYVQNVLRGRAILVFVARALRMRNGARAGQFVVSQYGFMVVRPGRGRRLDQQ